MTDRRDPEAEELRDRLDELESTLVALREELDDETASRDAPKIPRGLPGGGRRPPRPPRLSEVLRFTEEYTIPTLISVLETNIRLLQLGGAALRALDPERPVAGADAAGAADGAVRRALDAGRGFSTDRLADGLDDLNEALAGTEAPDPEARDLLNEAEALSTEIQERLRESRDDRESTHERGTDRQDRHAERTRAGGSVDAAEDADGAVHIDVTDASESDDAEGESDDGVDEPTDAPEPDVDAELDSIREEVRGSAGEDEVDEESADESGKPDEESGDDADGTALE